MKLWYNATFHAMDGNTYTQVATNNGIIVAVGDDCNNLETVEKIDLNKAHVFPGFTDAHMHLIGYGRKINNENIVFESDKIDLLETIKSMYKNAPLFIEGYIDIGITKEELDQIGNDLIILRHNDYHSFTVNSKVLELVGLKSETGIILDEFDALKINPLWNKYNKETLTKFAKSAVISLQSLGITSIHTDDLAYFNSWQETLDILDKTSKELKLRINSLVNYAVYDLAINNFPKNKFLNNIQAKTFYDGTISSFTALLYNNYRYTKTNGQYMITPSAFAEVIDETKKSGLAVHAIGNRALDEVVLLLKNSAHPRNRIIHASLATPAVLKKLKGLYIDIQPLFILSDEARINNVIQKDENLLVYPFKEYLEAGAVLNGSSDAPVENPNPLLSIDVLLKQGINNFDVLKMYTTNPYLTIDQKGGLIKEGYLADFTAFDLNILKIKNVLNAKVKYTIVDETIVYED